MQGVKCVGSTQRFLPFHEAAHNTFNVQHHLISARTHQTLGASAMQTSARSRRRRVDFRLRFRSARFTPRLDLCLRRERSAFARARSIWSHPTTLNGLTRGGLDLRMSGCLLSRRTTHFEVTRECRITSANWRRSCKKPHARPARIIVSLGNSNSPA